MLSKALKSVSGASKSFLQQTDWPGTNPAFLVKLMSCDSLHSRVYNSRWVKTRCGSRLVVGQDSLWVETSCGSRL